MRVLLALVLALALGIGVRLSLAPRSHPADGTRPPPEQPAAAVEPVADTVGCERTDAPVRVDTTSGFEDIRRGAVFSCRLRRGQPPVRMVLRADAESGIPVAVDVYGAEGAAPAQVLPVDDAAGRPPRGSRVLQGTDLNGDGWMDLKVLTMSGATGNEAFDVFRWEPSASRFVPDSVLTGEGTVTPVAGRPCVATHWHMGIGVHSDGEHCWRDGRWVLTRTEVGDYAPPGAADSARIHLTTIEELRDGRMQVVQVDTNAARH